MHTGSRTHQTGEKLLAEVPARTEGALISHGLLGRTARHHAKLPGKTQEIIGGREDRE